MQKLLKTQMFLCRVQQRNVTLNADTVTFCDIYCCSLQMKSHMLLPVIKELYTSDIFGQEKCVLNFHIRKLIEIHFNNLHTFHWL